jgi:CubicO group peptidase (beta-lactamase class C family)
VPALPAAAATLETADPPAVAPAPAVVAPPRAPAPAPDPATLAVRQSPEVQRALDAASAQVEAERQRRGVPGISVGVVYDQTLIWSHGFGTANVDTGAPATPETLYRVGSITKLFTDTMMMQLRDAGRLQLDDPLQRYLPELQIPSRYGSDLPTLREVASHTAGLPREAPLDYWHSRSFPTEGDLIASMQNSALIGPPGKVYQYSNLGVSLEGIALERVAGVPYTQYVTDNILRPLGMTESGFAVSDDVRTKLAAGSTPSSTSTQPPDRFPDFGALTPAAGLYSSVDDIARFISLQFRLDDANGSTVLSGPTLREMHDPSSRGGPSDFAIGWELGSVSGHGTIGHPGVVYGFTTQITLIPDSKLGVAVFTNGRTDPASIANQALSTLLPSVRAAAGE